MNIKDKAIITGANRGLGRALLDEALKREAKRVSAGTRSALQHPNKRVKPLALDVGATQQQVTQPHRSKAYPERARETESAVIDASVLAASESKWTRTN